jgi:hypothetical protein
VTGFMFILPANTFPWAGLSDIIALIIGLVLIGHEFVFGHRSSVP